MNRDGAASKIGTALSKYSNYRKQHASMASQSNASTWIAMITAIIGGFVALSTYRTDVSKRIDQSVAKTFDMISDWNADNLQAPRKRVLSYVYARRACDARMFSRELTEEDFIRVIEFFDLVQACVDANLCDAPTAQAFFGPHAKFSMADPGKSCLRHEPKLARHSVRFSFRSRHENPR